MWRILLFVILICPSAWAQRNRSSEDSGGGVGATQKRRSAERFNIIDWIRQNQERTREQDSKYAGGGGRGGGADLDLVFQYRQESLPFQRDGVKLGLLNNWEGHVQLLFDNLFTQGNKRRSLNIDLGIEGFYGASTSFTPEVGILQTELQFVRSGGGLLIRPLGRSSQDSGLILKGGYIQDVTKGFFVAGAPERSFSGTYVGAEAKLYLLPFLGARAEYLHVFGKKHDLLLGEVKSSSFLYSGFIEILLLDIEVYVINREWVLTPDASLVPQKEQQQGLGFAASLFF